MKKRMFLILFVSLIVIFVFNKTNVYAQKLEYEYSFDRYISDSLMNTIPYGVYLTHQEFLSGNPSITRVFEIEERSPDEQMDFNLRSRVLHVVNEKLEEMDIYYKPFWCAFDGQEMYLFYNQVIYKLEYTGRFNLCWNRRWKYLRYTSTYSNPKLYSVKSNIREVLKRKIVDFKTNEWYVYNNRGMKKLLQLNNIELYNKFIKEKRKRFKLDAYLKRLNGIKVAGW